MQGYADEEWDDQEWDDDEWDDGRQVFLCFAAADRAKAERIGGGLRRHGVTVADHEYLVGPGAQIVLAAEQALTESDYFVLLWSENACGRPWIDEVRTAAFVRDMREKRRFLFVVRLDDTPVPPLLTTRPQLDGRGDARPAVAELVATWARECALGDPVLPSPNPPERAPELAFYVQNRALSVYHKLEHVPAGATVGQLMGQTRAELRLRRQVTEFDGSVGLRFSYRFLLDDEPLPEDKLLAAFGLGHGDAVQLEVTIEPFGPDGGSAAGTYLSGDDGPEGAARLSPTLLRALADEAFSHLRPWDAP